MNIIRKIKDILSGRKSYIVGGLMILLGLLNGDNNLILEGLAVWGLRAAISK